MPDDKVLTPEQVSQHLTFLQDHGQDNTESAVASWTTLKTYCEALRAQLAEALVHRKIAMDAAESYRNQLERERGEYERHLQARLIAEKERDKALARAAAAEQSAEIRRQMVVEIGKSLDEEAKRCDEALAQVAALQEALQDLVDVQNGPPLPTYERDWNAAMKKVKAVLAQPEAMP